MTSFSLGSQDALGEALCVAKGQFKKVTCRQNAQIYINMTYGRVDVAAMAMLKRDDSQGVCVCVCLAFSFSLYVHFDHMLF